MTTFKEFAIFAKVAELGERYGLKPTDFQAEITFDWDKSITELNFMDAKPGKEANFTALVTALGAKDEEITGTKDEILEMLDTALAKAPKPPIKKSR